MFKHFPIAVAVLLISLAAWNTFAGHTRLSAFGAGYQFGIALAVLVIDAIHRVDERERRHKEP